MKPRLLDLFCGAGGCTKGYQDAGFHVTGVDLVASPNYCGDEFIQADVLDLLAYRIRDNFDAVVASPPCQGYSSKTRDHSKHRRLIVPTRRLLIQTGLPYVVENVEGARTYLLEPVRLCGSSFGLDVRRHRYFEANWPLVGKPCAHRLQTPRFRVYDHGKWYLSSTVPVFGTGGGKAREHWAKAMGVDWMSAAELAEAVPPAYTKHIGEQLLAAVSVGDTP